MPTRSLHPSRIFPVLRLLAAGFLLLGLLGFPAGGRAAGNILFAIPTPDLLNDCSSWAKGCSLQKAITTAVANDSIYVLMGTYYPGAAEADTFRLKSGVAIYGGFDGDEATLAERDPAANVTILSGEIGLGHAGDNSTHVVTGDGVDNKAVLDGFTITGGNADGGTPPYNSGGGMYIFNGSPTLNRLVFTGNQAFHFGGGMYLRSTTNPTMTNLVFASNTAFSGAGLYLSSSSPTLTNVSFNANQAESTGGGVLIDQSSPTFDRATFNANSANYGGALRASNSDPTIKNSAFIGNHATNYGGAIENMTGNMILTNVTFHNNGSDSASGGAIANEDNSTLDLNGATFSSNSAAYYGGAIYNGTASSSTVRNSILWGNTAGWGGAQILGTAAVSYSVVQGGYTGTGNRVEDPLLGAPAIYNDYPQVLPLLPGSSAIEAGNAATCLPTDGRAVTRPQGAACDMGAFESRGFSLAITGGDNQTAWIFAAFPQPLAVSVTSAYLEPVNGGRVRFSGPSSGAGAVLSANSVTIAGGSASVTATANGLWGTYTVTGSAAGAAAAVDFHLTNQAYLVQLPLVIR